MSDIASIGFAANTGALAEAKASLDALAPAAARTQKAVDLLNKATAGSSGPFMAAVKGTSELDRVLKAAAGSANISTSAMLNTGTGMRAIQAAAVGAAAPLNMLNGAVMSTGRALQQADAHIMAYKANLASLPAVVNNAKSSLDRLGAAANDNINRMQSTPGNIAAQFQDIGVTAAGGMSPLLIALQQGTQLSAAFQGGLGNLGAALRQMLNPVSLLTIAAVALIAYLIQMAMEMFSTGSAAETLSDKLDKVKFSSYAVSDAQSILGNVIDITTGKAKNQSVALIALARAQLLVAKVQSQARAAEAKSQISASAKPEWYMSGGMGGGFSIGRQKGPQAQIESQFRNGVIDYDKAVQGLERLRGAGRITDEVFANLAASYANLGVEIANQKVFDDAQRLLNGDSTGTGYLLKPDAAPHDKLGDIFEAAENDLAIEKTRLLTAAYGMNIDKAAELEQKTKMLNAMHQKGIPLTAAIATRVNELSAAYGKAKLAADTVEAFGKSMLATDAERDDLENQRALIGKYGEELLRLKYIQDLISKPQKMGIVFDAAQIEELTKRATSLAAAGQSIVNDRLMEDLAKGAEQKQFDLSRERGEIGLSTEATAAYRYETEMLNAARQKHIDLTPAELAAISATSVLYAQQAEQVRLLKEQYDFARGTAKGFFTDLFEGVQQGKTVWDAFADAAINALNKIIAKLMDRTIESLLDQMFSGVNKSGGGFFDSLLGNIMGSIGGGGMKTGNHGAGGYGDWVSAVPKGLVGLNAKGGVFDGPTGFNSSRGPQIAGEAGPEAAMPLTRGPDGTLGVRAFGGGPGAGPAPVSVVVNNDNRVTGAVSSQDIVEMQRASAERTKTEIAKALPYMIQQHQRDGAMV